MFIRTNFYSILPLILLLNISDEARKQQFDLGKDQQLIFVKTLTIDQNWIFYNNNNNNFLTLFIERSSKENKSSYPLSVIISPQFDREELSHRNEQITLNIISRQFSWYFSSFFFLNWTYYNDNYVVDIYSLFLSLEAKRSRRRLFIFCLIFITYYSSKITPVFFLSRCQQIICYLRKTSRTKWEKNTDPCSVLKLRAKIIVVLDEIRTFVNVEGRRKTR